MIRIDPKMMTKVDRALKQAGGLYSLDDIDLALTTGNMQSHAVDDTWVITEVQDFPRKRAVNILYVVGDLKGSFAADKMVEEWAISKGADMMTAVGRDGWSSIIRSGWKKVGTLYSKDLNHERR
jgi:hypothetical protein